MESNVLNSAIKIWEDNGDGMELASRLEGPDSDVAAPEDYPHPIHPLLLPPVMMNIFKNLEELATCRQVCTEWRYESLSTWRSTSIVIIRSMGFDGRVKLITSISDNVRAFIEFNGNKINECHLKPFHSYLLIFWAFGLKLNSLSDLESSPKFEEEQLPVDRFWQQVGVHITDLRLRCCGFVGIDDVRKVMYVACPNLQHLHMVHCQVMPNDDDVLGSFIYQYPSNETVFYTEPTFGEHIHMRSLTLDSCLPDSWLQILSHFSSLTTLNISGFTLFSTLNTPELLKAVQAIRQSCGKKLPLINVSPLRFNQEESTSQANFDLLLEFGFPLGEMWTSLNDEVDYDLLSYALQVHGHTLKALVVSPNPDIPSRFPFWLEFQNLTEFHLMGGLLEDLYFLENLSNLEILEIRPWYGGGSEIAAMFATTSELEMAQLKLPKLKKLELGYEMTENNLRRLAQFLPNLEELQMPLDDMLLGVVCENWEHLLKLTDSSDQITNEGVIGIPLGDGAGGSGVVQLKRLERFVSGSDKLTWLALQNGFMKMCSLNFLDIPLMMWRV